MKARTPDGYTALMYAVMGNNATGAELLLAKGADVNATTDDGSTALIFASLYGSLQCVHLLLKSGVSINARNNGGWTALKAALDPTGFSHPPGYSAGNPHRGPFTQVAKVLKKAGASE